MEKVRLSAQDRRFRLVAPLKPLARTNVAALNSTQPALRPH